MAWSAGSALLLAVALLAVALAPQASAGAKGPPAAKKKPSAAPSRVAANKSALRRSPSRSAPAKARPVTPPAKARPVTPPTKARPVTPARAGATPQSDAPAGTTSPAIDRAAARRAARRRAAARARRRRQAAELAARRLRTAAARAALRSGPRRAPAAATSAPATPLAPASGPARTRAPERRPAAPSDRGERRDSPVVRRVREIVEVVPGPVKVALAALALLSALLLGGYFAAALRSRRLTRQRGELLQEVGLLQAALLPRVPSSIGSVAASVAYRPSDGPGAGGDFYDAIALPEGRAGFVLGDVSGHGREALSHTAFMRYTLRAYLEAGLEPRAALQVAERVAAEHLGGDFATVILAVHDPRTGTLTYATAGHPAPIVLGETSHEPMTAVSSPPIGWDLPTGLRQTTIPLAAGSRALLYTDGLEEAPTGNGRMLGRDRLTEIATDCGPEATAPEILDRVVSEASEARDDMAACLITPAVGVSNTATPIEQLELLDDDSAHLLPDFLEGCGVGEFEADRVRTRVAEGFRDQAGALVSVHLDGRATWVEVLPRDTDSIEAASRRPRLASLDG